MIRKPHPGSRLRRFVAREWGEGVDFVIGDSMPWQGERPHFAEALVLDAAPSAAMTASTRTIERSTWS